MGGGFIRGKIIRGIAGFYYVHVAERGVYECRAKGVFRDSGQKPLVGDDVEIAVISETDMTGSVERLLPRRSELIRPAVANVDMALLIMAAREPEPNMRLLDRFLIAMQMQGVQPAICFNKADLTEGFATGCDAVNGDAWITVNAVGRDGGGLPDIIKIYAACGYPLILTSAKMGTGLEDLRELLRGKTTVLAGPSGVGKSSLVNLLQPDVRMETGEISRKTERGRHTTRRAELMPLRDAASYIVDTPGFTSLDLPDLESGDVRLYYPEFAPYAPLCRYADCRHISEPDCAVKAALADGKISRLRYDNYVAIYEERKAARQY